MTTSKQHHNHAACVEKAMDAAEQVCRDNGVKLTDTRRKVLQMVWQGHSAVKAYDLIERFDGGKGATKPPTIYRALDFLVENGLVHRIASLNAFVGCSHPAEGHEGNFFICDDCNDVIEMEGRPLSQPIEKMAKSKGFRVGHKTVEIHGTCGRCAAG